MSFMEYKLTKHVYVAILIPILPPARSRFRLRKGAYALFVCAHRYSLVLCCSSRMFSYPFVFLFVIFRLFMSWLSHLRDCSWYFLIRVDLYS
jgi:hypothetical protein